MKRIIQLMFPFTGLLMVQGQDLENQPAPRAVPVEDLLPKFSNDEKVTSATEQFTVSGGDSAARGTAANLAEETKQELLKLTEEEDEWKVPISVKLQGKEGSEVPKSFTALKIRWYEGKGYEVEVYVNLSRGLQPESFKRAVTAALIFSRGLRQREAGYSDVRLSVPPWFVEGLLEASAWRLKQTDRKLYDALLRHGGLFKLDDLFAVTDAEFGSIDAVSKAAFRVSSGALVMGLLEQPDGKSGVKDFLEELPAFQGEMPSLLRKHYPDLNLSEDSMEKLWALQLADKGTAPLTESMSITATEKALNDALKIRYRDAEGVLIETPVSEWSGIGELSETERINAVRLSQDDLLRLSYRCFPSYRPLLLEYQMLLTDFAKGKTGDFGNSIAALDETRMTMNQKAETARDFLDWFEITRARETSGAFEDYLNLKARLKVAPNTKKDDLSKYLDRLDPLFTLPQERQTFGMGGGSFPY